MKLIKDEPSKTFTPFRLTLEIESEDEARLLWHVFDRLQLRSEICKDTIGMYNSKIAETFCYAHNADAIREEIQRHVAI